MVVQWHCIGKESGTKMSKFVGQMIGLTALYVGWTHGNVLLIFSGTFVLVMESMSNWRDE